MQSSMSYQRSVLVIVSLYFYALIVNLQNLSEYFQQQALSPVFYFYIIRGGVAESVSVVFHPHSPLHSKTTEDTKQH